MSLQRFIVAVINNKSKASGIS